MRTNLLLHVAVLKSTFIQAKHIFLFTLPSEKIGWTSSFCSFMTCGALTISVMKTQSSSGTSVTNCCTDLLILPFLFPFYHLCRRKPIERLGMQIPGQEHWTKLSALQYKKDLHLQPSCGRSRTSTKSSSTSPSSLGKKCTMRE